MQQGKKILSLCIPTYNRADKLDRLLGWLQEQAVGAKSQVEICISSNGSTDGTDGVVAKWKKSLPIAYRKNARNRGFDFNAIAAIRMARGEYCWILGDDDRPAGNAVGTLLDDIRSLGKRKVGAIYVSTSHSTAYLGGRKFSEIPDGPFRVYSLADRAYPPLSLLHLSLLCLHRRTALGIIREKTYARGDIICKRENDPNMLHFWVQTYIFLECVRKSGYFGIEPKSQVRLISDGDATATYERKLYTDMASLNYVYDIRKNYPDFNADFFPIMMRGHFLRVAMACENPRLEKAYLAATVVFVKLLEMENRRKDIALVRLVEKIRGIPMAAPLISSAYRLFLLARGRGNALVNEKEPSPERRKSLEFYIRNTERKFGN